MSETTATPPSFICSHVADRSLLAQGFTLPGTMLVDFTSWFGTLAPGQARDMNQCGSKKTGGCDAL